MPPISVMLKPSSSSCNLRCSYCFYHDVASSRGTPSTGNMTTSTLENVIKKAFAHADGHSVFISFQGGEPLLRGKDFFRAAFSFIEKYNIKNSKVSVGIQTNGTLIDEEWCKLFYKHDVLVGLSLDGDELRNKNRIDSAKKGVFGRVIGAAQLLQSNFVRFNILTVLTRDVADNIETVYAFFKGQGFDHLQFIPCLKPLDGKVSDESLYLDGDSYRNFLFKAFKLYLADIDRGGYTSVRQFDNFVTLVHGNRAEQCGMNGHCTHQYVIEGDGSVYPCDFYCTDEYLLGNVNESDFYALEHSEKAMNFIKESLVTDEKCKACEVYRLCFGGCKREKKDVDKCDAYKSFFKWAIPLMKRIT